MKLFQTLSNLLNQQKETQSVSPLASNAKICLIAGKGELPKEVIRSAKNNLVPLYIIAIDGHADTDLKQIADIEVKLGQFGKIVKILKKQNISQICCAGKIARPSMKNLKLDLKTAKFLAKIGIKNLSGGDNKLLNLVDDFFANHNIKLVAPEVIAPDILSPEGCFTKAKPSSEDMRDISLGEKLINDFSKYDIGQAVIIENQYVLGIEAAEGTDQLIKRIKSLKKEKNLGVLVKKPKKGQNMKIDLPTIGINTVNNAIESGLKGIAISAGKTIVINKDEIVKLANKHKFFIVGL